MPTELIQSLSYYYFYPIKVTVNLTSKPYEVVFMSRVTGSTSSEDIAINVILRNLLSKMNIPSHVTYRHEENAARLTLDYDKLDLRFIANNDTVIVHYNKLETLILLQKLKFIQDQLNKYKILGLTSSELREKLTKYSY